MTLLAARALVSGADKETTQELLNRQSLDWGQFNRLIRYHELSPSAYIILKEFPALVSQEELRLLEQQFYCNLLRLSLLQQELIEIMGNLQARNITVLPLKGAHFLLDPEPYGDKAYLRPMLDMDILVKKGDYHEAQRILESRGYLKELYDRKEEYWRSRSYHLAFRKKSGGRINYMVELHWGLDYPKNNHLLPQFWERSIKRQREGGCIYLCSPEDTLLSLALHQRRFGKMLLLKNACDVALLLRRYKDALDWDYLLREAKEARMLTVLYFVLFQAEFLFGPRIPDAFLKTSGVAGYKRKLIRDFILEDTFSCRPDLKRLYLKAHFLLYDNFAQPLRVVLNIPQEQFAKFYGLSPYVFTTVIRYHFRWFYFIKSCVEILHKTSIRRR